MPSELLDMNCRQLRDRIAAGDVKSNDVTEAVFEAIKEYEPTLGTYISTLQERALEKSKEVDSRIAAGEPVGSLAGQT